jgi:carbohydrate kinase (thermoresistant glucokinase family)
VPTDLPTPVVLVVMGVSGSGKSTVGVLIAERLGWTFEEGDSLHPLSNVEKMAAGVPLTDEDRWPWLAKIADWVDGQLDTGQNGVITCSALKRSYRALINRRGTGVEFVYLAVGRSELVERVEQRPGHFMPASLLDSQLETLEVPSEPEPFVRVDAGADATLVVDRLLRDLGLASRVVPLAPNPPKPTRAAKPTVTKPAASKRTPRAKS